MSSGGHIVTIDAINLPMVADLYGAVHAVLVLRLMGDLQTKEGLIAWNRLIVAHDAIAYLRADSDSAPTEDAPSGAIKAAQRRGYGPE